LIEGLTTLAAQKRIRWIYWPPLIHFGICITAMLGFVVPPLQFLGILMMFVNIADFPISLVGLALAFHHGALAWIWIVGVGTLWWYLLARAAEFVFNKFISRTYVD
jgi:hypothetical protein